MLFYQHALPQECTVTGVPMIHGGEFPAQSDYALLSTKNKIFGTEKYSLKENS